MGEKAYIFKARYLYGNCRRICGGHKCEGHAQAIEIMLAAGIEVKVLGDEVMVSGQHMKQAMIDWGFELVYSVAGPSLMAALMSGRVLNRLYLSQVDIMVGGREFHTLYPTEAPLECAGDDFTLQSLYRSRDSNGPGQSFMTYDLE